MFEWLSGRTPIQRAIDEEDYPRAMKLISEEIQRDPRPVKVRPLRQTMAEVLALHGQKDAALLTLRSLMAEYTSENNDGKAIAIHKRIAAIKPPEEEDLDRLAAAVAAEPKAIDLSTLDEETSKKVSEQATTKIAKTPLFSALGKEEVRALIQGLRLQTKGPGDLVMVEGEPGDSLFILTDGTVRVHVKNAAQKSVAIRDIEGGSFFGEISIVYGKPRTATITCTTGCEILELDKGTLDGITAKHPGVGKVLKDFCDQRVQSREEQEGRKSS